jgi:segregation and condensation protein A
MSEPLPGATAQRFQAGAFDGPLDLLLHLVRINEVELTDIPIVEITAQYNAYLDLMRELDLEVAGEYLLLAATLMHIKSRMLLPPDPQAPGEERLDPRTELARQLADYQRFRQAAESLQAMEARRSLVWTREGVPPEFEGEQLLAVDVFDLMRAFEQLLGRLGAQARLELRRDTVSVAEKMQWLTDVLRRRGSAELGELFAELPTQLERIAVFLALLELVRQRVVLAFQRRLFDEIRVALVPEPR